MTRIRLLPSIQVFAILCFASSLALASENPAASANGPRPAAGQSTGQLGTAPSTGSSFGAESITRPSSRDDGGYNDDSTVHRTGQQTRTNADGSDFETGQDDGPDNTTYPGD